MKRKEQHGDNNISESYMTAANYYGKRDAEMNRKRLDAKLLEDLHALIHPTRYRIVELLEEKPMHINALSRALAEDRRLVTFHLQKLEKHGFVTSKYKLAFVIKQKGKAFKGIYGHRSGRGCEGAN